MKSTDVRYIVYAAGISSRMNADAQRGLKSLIKIGDHRLIDAQLSWISQVASEIVIVIGLEHEALKSYIGSTYRGIPIKWVTNENYRDKGNMLSLWAAREYCDRDTLFTVSDLVADRSNIRKFLSNRNATKVLIDRSPTRFTDPDPVKVRIDSGRITKILKKMPMSDIHGCAIGIYQLSEKAITGLLVTIESAIKAGDDNKSLYYAINDSLGSDCYTPVFTENELWLDVDTPEELDKAMSMVDKNFINESVI